jgi:hypothetical protein
VITVFYKWQGVGRATAPSAKSPARPYETRSASPACVRIARFFPFDQLTGDERGEIKPKMELRSRSPHHGGLQHRHNQSVWSGRGSWLVRWWGCDRTLSLHRVLNNSPCTPAGPIIHILRLWIWSCDEPTHKPRTLPAHFWFLRTLERPGRCAFVPFCEGGSKQISSGL